MGAFLVNFHAKTDDAAPVREVLSSAAERAWIGPAINGWVSFYEERADIQDAVRIEELCQQVSEATGGGVIAFLVHDSDFLCYVLFENGRKQDEYNSCPEYFGDISEMLEPGDSRDDYLARLRGDADALRSLCPAGTDREALEKLLRVQLGEYVFAEQHLDQLARLLGIEPERATTTYRDIGLEITPDELGLEFVGSGTRPEPGEDAWNRRFGQPASGPAAESLHLFQPGSESDEGPSLTDLLAFAQNPDQKLALAVMAKSPEAIQEAIAAGADLDAAGGTPLATAVGIGSEEMVRLLLEAGASAQAATSALEVAATKGDESLLRLLLDHGADANHVNSFNGWSLMHFAVHSRKPEIIRLLLSAGADPTLRDKQGETPATFVKKLIQQTETAAAHAAADGRPYPHGEEVLPGLRAVLEVLDDAT